MRDGIPFVRLYALGGKRSLLGDSDPADGPRSRHLQAGTVFRLGRASRWLKRRFWWLRSAAGLLRCYRKIVEFLSLVATLLAAVEVAAFAGVSVGLVLPADGEGAHARPVIILPQQVGCIPGWLPNFPSVRRLPARCQALPGLDTETREERSAPPATCGYSLAYQIFTTAVILTGRPACQRCASDGSASSATCPCGQIAWKEYTITHSSV